MGVYSNFIMDLLSKDNNRFRKENECLKNMINKFISGEYSREKLIQEFQLLIDKDKKEVN
jgi:uncharacterized membrane protein YheB (UPF0754 family)